MQAIRPTKPYPFLFWLLATLTLQPFSTLSAHAEILPTIIISEINWAGSTLSTADEWIELANITSVPIDISNWQLVGASTNSISIPEETVLNPGETYVVANHDSSNEKSQLFITPNLVTTSISLSNSSLNIKLFDNTNLLIDEAGNSMAPFAGFVINEDLQTSSMERISLFSGQLPESWSDSSNSIGLKNENDLGSPGYIPFIIEPYIDPATEETPVILEEAVIEPEEPTLETTDLETINEQPLAEEEIPAEPTNNPETVTDTLIEETITEPLEIILDQTPEEEPLETVIEDIVEVLEVESVEEINNEEQTIETIQPETPEIQKEVTETRAPIEIKEIEDIPPSPNPSTSSQTNNQATELPPISFWPTDLTLSELFPRPSEGAEWLELKCSSCLNKQLLNWHIEDASGKQTSLDSVMFLHEYIVINNPAGKLNNDQETIKIIRPDNSIADEIFYGRDGILPPKSNESFSKQPNGKWLWTSEATPNTENFIVPEIVEKETTQEELQIINPEEESIEQYEHLDTVIKTNEIETVTKIEEIEDLAKNEISIETENINLNYQNILRLSEFYAVENDSNTPEEYIELENLSNEKIFLKNWSLKDRGGKKFIFSYEVIEPNGFIAIPHSLSKISLNNDGDTISLFAPDESTVDIQTYPKQAKGQSYALINNTWQTTTDITPGTKNNYLMPIKTSPTKKITVKNTSTTTSYSTKISWPKTKIKEARPLKNDTKISVEGFILIPPNVIGKTTFYIFDETGGLQIYFSKAEYPELKTGQAVEIKGTLSTVNNERRLKIASVDDIKSGTVIMEPLVEVSNIKDASQKIPGSLVEIQGRVAAKQNQRLTLEYGGEQIFVDNTSLVNTDDESLKTGKMIRATGVVSKTTSGSRLIATNIEPITEETNLVSGISDTNLVTPTKTNNKEKIGLFLTVTTLLGIVFLAGRSFILKQKGYAKRKNINLGTAGTH